MRMRVLTVVSLLTSCTALADTADDVRCREIGFSRAAETQDGEKFVSFIDRDARFVSNTVLRGPEEIAAAWTVFFDPDGPTIRWRPKYIEVLEDGSLALSRGPYRVITRDENGVASEQWGTFNSVWRLNADGVWRVVFDAGSSEAAAPDEDTRSLLDSDDDCPVEDG